MAQTFIGVELVEVGTWDASTGPWSVTTRDLLSMVASQVDPTVPTPRVYFGHGLDPERTAAGRIVGLRVTPDGLALLGDLVDVDDSVTPQAWPSRSVEAWTDYTSASGRRWPAVLSGVALLGSSQPAVGSLADLPAARTVAGTRVAASTVMRYGARRVLQSRLMPAADTQSRAASVSAETIRDNYYASLSGDDAMVHWVREVLVEPAGIVVDTGAQLDLVAYTIADDQSVTFGERTEVRPEYVPVAAAAPEDDEGDEDEGDEDEATAAALRPTSFPPPVRAAAARTPGTVTIDEGTLATLRAAAAEGDTARQVLATRQRDEAIDGAIGTGRIPPARREHWAALWSADPEGTRTVLAGLAPGTVAATTPAGYAAAPPESGDLTDWDRDLLGLDRS
ncbi:hypothetical protein BH24ACT5_BH24ACT5_15520 [soil metagenome]